MHTVYLYFGLTEAFLRTSVLYTLLIVSHIIFIHIASRIILVHIVQFFIKQENSRWSTKVTYIFMSGGALLRGRGRKWRQGFVSSPKHMDAKEVEKNLPANPNIND